MVLRSQVPHKTQSRHIKASRDSDLQCLLHYKCTAALTSSVNNSVVATASSPGQTNNVSDTSDDGDDTDGNTTDDVQLLKLLLFQR